MKFQRGFLKSLPSFREVRITLRAGQYGDQIPVEAGFSVSVQPGPGAHLVSYAKGKGSFQGVKRPRRGVDHPPPAIAEVK